MITKIKFHVLFFCLVSLSTEAQEVERYQGSLVEYLTEVNLKIETKVVTEYCNCTNKKKFIEEYQEVAIAFNKTINKHISELSRLRAKEALIEFDRINENGFVNSDKSFKNATKKLTNFSKFSCINKKVFLPAAITIAEITGIANSIIGLINEGKKRRDAQRDKLIAILETFKIPSIQSYECDKDKE